MLILVSVTTESKLGNEDLADTVRDAVADAVYSHSGVEGLSTSIDVEHFDPMYGEWDSGKHCRMRCVR